MGYQCNPHNRREDFRSIPSWLLKVMSICWADEHCPTLQMKGT